MNFFKKIIRLTFLRLASRVNSFRAIFPVAGRVSLGLLLSAKLSSTAFASGSYHDDGLSCVGINVNNASELHIALLGVDPNPSTGEVTQAGDTICVAARTYKPEIPGSFCDPNEPGNGQRCNTFEVAVENLTLQGVGMHDTVLSGDFKGDDIPICDGLDPETEICDLLAPENNAQARQIDENAFHVVFVNTSLVKNLTLRDLKVTKGNADSESGGAFEFFDRIGGGIWMFGMQNGAVLQLTRVSIHANNAADYGAGIEADGIGFFGQGPERATLRIEHSEVSDNVSLFTAGGADAFGTDVVVSHSVFDNNHADFGDAAMYITDGTADIQRNVFKNGRSRAVSAAFRLDSESGNVEIVGGSIIAHNIFKDNRVQGEPPQGANRSFGGAVVVDGYDGVLAEGSTEPATVDISHNVFADNRVTGSGGALWSRDAKVSVVGNLFSKNKSTELSSGAVLLSNGPAERATGAQEPYNIEFKYNVFIDNSSATGGGALTILDSYLPVGGIGNTYNLEYNSFIRNHAGDDAGALFADGQNIFIKGNLFAGNRAGGNGGAIVASSRSRNEGFYQVVADNFAQAPLTDRISSLLIEDSVFIGNRAKNDGGAISDSLANQHPSYEANLLFGVSLNTGTGPGFSYITIDDSSFSLNRAEGKGGALAMTGEGQRSAYNLCYQLGFLDPCPVNNPAADVYPFPDGFDFSNPVPPFPNTAYPWLPNEDSDLLYSTLTVTDTKIRRNHASEGKDVYILDLPGRPTDPNGKIDLDDPANKIRRCQGPGCP